MAMDIGPGAGEGADDEVMMDINTTPLIDVMLVLIIMLIITIPVSLHAVRLATPRAAATAPPPQPTEVTLAITAAGGWQWNGEALPDRAALDRRLAALADTPDHALRLQPAADAPYAAVAAVLSSAQRLGVGRLGLGDLAPYAR
jgi:biopolymer transport protein ExbD